MSDARMIKNVNTAEHYCWGAGCDGWRLLDRSDLSVTQERIVPGEGEVLHYHCRARQLFFVIAGALEISLGERVFCLSPGDSLEVPPGDRHLVRNPGQEDVTFLVVSAPTTRGDRINVDPEAQSR